MSKRYLVTAPYITVTVSTPDGPKVLGFYSGVTLPDGVSKESIKHHLDRGMIAESDEPAPEPPETAAGPVEPTPPPAKPSGKSGGG